MNQQHLCDRTALNRDEATLPTPVDSKGSASGQRGCERTTTTNHHTTTTNHNDTTTTPQQQQQQVRKNKFREEAGVSRLRRCVCDFRRCLACCFPGGGMFFLLISVLIYIYISFIGWGLVYSYLFFLYICIYIYTYTFQRTFFRDLFTAAGCSFAMVFSSIPPRLWLN